MDGTNLVLSDSAQQMINSSSIRLACMTALQKAWDDVAYGIYSQLRRSAITEATFQEHFPLWEAFIDTTDWPDWLKHDYDNPHRLKTVFAAHWLADNGVAPEIEPHEADGHVRNACAGPD